MSKNQSFTIDLGQESEQPTSSEAPSSGNSGEVRPSAHAQAWEINFGSGDDQSSQRKPSLPKFLRDREINRSSSGTELLKSNSRTRQPARSSTSPLKARDPKPIARPPSKSNTSPPRHSTTRLGSSGLAHSFSPKKSPTIKKPLLPVTSPTKKSSRTTELKSQSDCSLTQGTNKKSGSKRTRPHSATSSPDLAWQESTNGDAAIEDVDARDDMTARSSKDGGHPRRNRTEKPTSNIEVPRASKSLPVVTLGVVEGHSKLASTPDEMAQRKVLDLKRWYCMCHPQYSKSCGISSVISCWNYLFSTLGNGSLPPITQEEALTILGFQPPFGEIKFGPFTGNITCMRWFQQLCGHFGVCGQAYYFYKPVGRRKTAGINPSMALEKFQEGLRSSDTAFVYHCSNHYFCPIGYEQVPRKATDAYRVSLRHDEVDTWVLIGEPSRRHPAIHCVRWDNIVKDLTCESPDHFNIRHMERGVVVRNTKRKGTNIHCIMALKRVRESILAALTWRADGGTEDYDGEEVSESEVEDLDSSDSEYPVEQTPHRANTSTASLSGDLESIDLESVDLSNIYPHSGCRPGAEDSAQEAVAIGSGIRRRGTFTKDRPTVEVKLTREPSTDSDFSVDSNGVDDGEDDPPELPPDGATPTADSAFVLKWIPRSGTFTKDAPTVHVQRTRAWSSDDESDTSQHDEANATRSSHEAEELLEGTAGVSDTDRNSQTKSSDIYTIEPNTAASQQAHHDQTETTSRSWKTFAETSRDDSDNESHSSERDPEVFGHDDSPLPESNGHRRRRGTYTKDEPSLDVSDLDLDATLKASDYADLDASDSV